MKILASKRNKKAQSLRSNRGFTLVEIISVIVLLAIFGGLGYALLRDTSTAGRDNVLSKNVQELNSVTTNLQATGAVFATGTAGVVQGTSTTAATITLPATATTGAVDAYLNALETTGIRSMGINATLARDITNNSYTYTMSGNIPVWVRVTGATTP